MARRFTVDDLLQQLEQMKPMKGLAKMIPGLSADELYVDDNEAVRCRALAQSMTAKERQQPEILEASRRQRIARGSGTTTKDVGRLMNCCELVSKMFQMWDRKQGV